MQKYFRRLLTVTNRSSQRFCLFHLENFSDKLVLKIALQKKFKSKKIKRHKNSPSVTWIVQRAMNNMSSIISGISKFQLTNDRLVSPAHTGLTIVFLSSSCRLKSPCCNYDRSKNIFLAIFYSLHFEYRKIKLKSVRSDKICLLIKTY